MNVFKKIWMNIRNDVFYVVSLAAMITGVIITNSILVILGCFGILYDAIDKKGKE
jgi:hypothetical protein